MKEFFKPELRNRIDQVCKFVKLDTLAVKKVVIKFVDELKSTLSERRINLTLSESVVDWLADKGYDSKMGARPLSRKIDKLIRVPLSRRILFDRLENCNILAVMDGEQVKFVTEDPVVQASVDEQGIIVLDQTNTPI